MSDAQHTKMIVILFRYDVRRLLSIIYTEGATMYIIV